MGGSAAAPAPAQPAKAAAPRPAPEPMPSAVVADSTRGQLSIATDPLPDFLTSRAQGPKADPFTPVELTFSWELLSAAAAFRRGAHLWLRSEEHTSELQSLMRISYAVFSFNK